MRYAVNMETEQQARVLRAMRAWLGIEQAEAANGGGIAERTLLDAEKGRACSDKTWTAMIAFYGSRGIFWRGDDAPVAIIILSA